VINDAVFALARIAEIDEDLTTKIVDDIEDLAWPFAATPKQRCFCWQKILRILNRPS